LAHAITSGEGLSTHIAIRLRAEEPHLLPRSTSAEDAGVLVNPYIRAGPKNEKRLNPECTSSQEEEARLRRLVMRRGIKRRGDTSGAGYPRMIFKGEVGVYEDFQCCRTCRQQTPWPALLSSVDEVRRVSEFINKRKSLPWRQPWPSAY
jgi:hypothetical protein